MFGVCMCLFYICVVLCLGRGLDGDELITRLRSPTVCKNDPETGKQRPGPKGAVESVEKKKSQNLRL
jgi:hypothetical protein